MEDEIAIGRWFLGREWSLRGLGIGVIRSFCHAWGIWPVAKLQLKVFNNQFRKPRPAFLRSWL